MVARFWVRDAAKDGVWGKGGGAGRLLRQALQIVLEVAIHHGMQSARPIRGYSLRFARIVRLRPDKPAEAIDTLEGVAEIFQAQGA